MLEHLSRRAVLGTIAGAGVGALLPTRWQEAKPATAGQHEVVALPFDPKALKGLSEKLLVSHHANNYGGAVKNLNKVEAELQQTTKDTPPWLVAALRERELTFRNSAALHELYFGNLGDSGEVAAALKAAVGRKWSSWGRFEEQFRAAGMGLGGGSGWVVLAFDLHRASLAIGSSGHHTQAMAAGLPLLVMDMYEHAYALDYGAAAGKYVEAFFANIRWAEVSHRFERAQKAAAALKG